MNPLIYTLKRVRAILQEIEHIRESEFPYPHAKKALDVINEHFTIIQDRLKGRDPKSTATKNYLPTVLNDIFTYLPLLGFILRSTNVRNAFEVYRPLLRLIGDIMEPTTPINDRTTKLILSSDWDFSPYVYSELYTFQTLEGFVLIGLPASESDNVLLIPLVGHEIGHPLWRIKKIEFKIKSKITIKIIDIIKRKWSTYKVRFPTITNPDMLESDMFALEIYSPAVEWALRQAEESFCDFIGIRLFGESFLHAFAYLLSPGVSGERSIIYPTILTRIKNQITAFTSFKYENTRVTEYSSMFYENEEDNSLMETDKFRLKLADDALIDIIDDLIKIADNIVENTSVIKPDINRVNYILEKYKKLSPATKCESIVDIINAAWMVFSSDEIWGLHNKAKENKDRILNELVLKNIEVFEVEQIIAEKEKG